MRRLAALWIAGLLASIARPGAAFADRAATLSARGEVLAKEGKLVEAIATFKEADRSRMRASHACLIALAYVRLEKWSQAEVYLDACRVRSTASDPLPKWFALAHQQLVERLATADVAAVDIRIEPASLAATAAISVSSFAPDEQFAPQTIHLPRGRHVVTAVVQGGQRAEQTLEVTGTGRLTVSFDFRPEAAAGGVGVVVPGRGTGTVTAERTRIVPWTVTAGGGVVLAAAVAYHLFVFKPVRDKLIDATDDTPDPQLYDANEGTFETRRAVSITLYGVGAAALITGLVLLKYSGDDDRPARLTLEPTPGGGIVGVAWTR